LTHATIAGILLNDLIHGRNNAWAALYDPSRITLKAAKEFSEENLNVAAQYTDWLTPSDVNSLEEIKPGNGALLRKGFKKYAIYRDLEGKFHCCSAVCPHLGCIVQWNKGENSWDCPCHGSRFSATGSVLVGPAISDLTAADEAFDK
jgi:Rieske Fe-S protein